MTATMAVAMRLWGRVRRLGMGRLHMRNGRGVRGLRRDTRLGMSLRALRLGLELGARPLCLLSLLQLTVLRLLGLSRAGLHIRVLHLRCLALGLRSRPLCLLQLLVLRLLSLSRAGLHIRMLRLCCLALGLRRRALSLLGLLQLVPLRLLGLLGRLVLRLFGMRHRLTRGDIVLRVAWPMEVGLRSLRRSRLGAHELPAWPRLPGSCAVLIVRARRGGGTPRHAGLRMARPGIVSRRARIAVREGARATIHAGRRLRRRPCLRCALRSLLIMTMDRISRARDPGRTQRRRIGRAMLALGPSPESGEAWETCQLLMRKPAAPHSSWKALAPTGSPTSR